MTERNGKLEQMFSRARERKQALKAAERARRFEDAKLLENSWPTRELIMMAQSTPTVFKSDFSISISDPTVPQHIDLKLQWSISKKKLPGGDVSLDWKEVSLDTVRSHDGRVTGIGFQNGDSITLAITQENREALISAFLNPKDKSFRGKLEDSPLNNRWKIPQAK